MYGLIVAAGFMIGEFIYHHYADHPAKPVPAREVDLPRNDEGAPVPIFYGRCRISAPIIVWVGKARAVDAAAEFPGRFLYSMDMLFVLGTPCDGGSSKIFGVYAGDDRLVVGAGGSFVPLEDLVGDGGFEDDFRPCVIERFTTESAIVGGVEFLNGNPDIVLVDPVTGDGTTAAGVVILLNGGVVANAIPAYRGYTSAFLYGFPHDSATPHFQFGTDPTVGQFSFEAGSYAKPHLAGGGSNKIGDDMNPVGVIVDILGKLGIDPARIDSASFAYAASTLIAESHGYSRCFDQVQTGSEMIAEVLTQIDGLLFYDPTDDLIKLRLIRPDYDPRATPLITPDNCQELQNFASGGWVDITNRVRVVFTDRESGYKDGAAVADNHANAVGQDNGIRETQIAMPGITTQYVADTVAGRELEMRSRPLMKLRAIVNRSFLRVLPGDPIRLSWPEANISEVVFRVANVDRGTLENGAIAIDLIQDYFYQHRGSAYPISAVALGIKTSKPAV